MVSGQMNKETFVVNKETIALNPTELEHLERWEQKQERSRDRTAKDLRLFFAVCEKRGVQKISVTFD